jgi:hypothetical protein
MAQLFKIADCIESPKGIVIAGADQHLDSMSHDELQRLLKGIHSVSIVGQDRRLDDVVVQGISVTSSVGNGRNVFLLLSPEVSRDSIPSDGIVLYPERTNRSASATGGPA